MRHASAGQVSEEDRYGCSTLSPYLTILAGSVLVNLLPAEDDPNIWLLRLLHVAALPPYLPYTRHSDPALADHMCKTGQYGLC